MRVLLPAFLVVASIVVVAATDQYLFCPIYTFKNTKPFSGDSIYNPYAAVLPQDWVRCNFHAHIHCWGGITNGHGSASTADSVYNSLHYGVHVISNYMRIDTTCHTEPFYVPGYEHGYNIRKNHQLVLGAAKVCWKDYLLPQTLNNKQDIINRLSADTNTLVIVNHPMVRNGYSVRDFQYLTHYSCLDVLSPSCLSTAMWDAALSAGKPVFTTGNDDEHNIYDSNRVGWMCTWINVAEINKANTLNAIKTGKSYGMIVGKQTLLNQHKGKDFNLPFLQHLAMNGNTMNTKFNKPASKIIISGQNGRILHTAYDTDSVTYTLGKQEPYAREVAIFNDSTQIFLNPVFRYKTLPLYQAAVVVNKAQTLLFGTLGAIVLVLWFGVVFKVLFPKAVKKNIKQTKYERIPNSLVPKNA
jgi:hypothetical protein